jgi:hypothetical protein
MHIAQLQDLPDAKKSKMTMSEDGEALRGLAIRQRPSEAAMVAPAATPALRCQGRQWRPPPNAALHQLLP